MRKTSREMPSDWAYEIFDKAPYITVAMTDEEGTPYAVPLSLARSKNEVINENKNGSINHEPNYGVYYFHGAVEGKKLDILSKHPKVWLSAVAKCKPTVGPKDGSFTLEFKSAMAQGVAEIITDNEEKIKAMRHICERFLPHHMDAFDASIARSLSRTSVVRITLTEPPTGKRKQYDSQGEEMKYGRME